MEILKSILITIFAMSAVGIVILGVLEAIFQKENRKLLGVLLIMLFLSVGILVPFVKEIQTYVHVVLIVALELVTLLGISMAVLVIKEDI
jgi:uncharacterized membrane protein